LSRRVSLPAADDLFRRTDHADGSRPERQERTDRPDEAGIRVVPDDRGDRGYGRYDERPAPAADSTRDEPGRKPSGRVRHDEKMTVYVTSAELLELEQARLMLRALHGLAVDRGRLVREAISLVLADFEAHGDESVLVRRLTEE
jgi:hypothetical protein